eukprot:TRINITY_DN29079_c0_g1_i1.p1 TRINITY_DN29079_c0_g1~~TRINITY_DN29079_c0_g1_i1.p1  ORF type:complete len:285 (+),score=27.48 TRINITY_DN29079_c0_g1_i1:46-900(+)
MDVCERDLDGTITCLCGHTCGTEKALERHLTQCPVRMRAGKGVDSGYPGPQVSQLPLPASLSQRLAAKGIDSDDEGQQAAPPTFLAATWSGPGRRQSVQRRRTWSGQEPSQSKNNFAPEMTVPHTADNDMLRCACSFTCGTPKALARHREKCTEISDRGEQQEQKRSDRFCTDTLRFGEASVPLASCPVSRVRPPKSLSRPKAAGSRLPVRLLLVRHAESANRRRSKQEAAANDPELSELGRRQAEALAHRLARDLAQEEDAAKGSKEALQACRTASKRYCMRP